MIEKLAGNIKELGAPMDSSEKTTGVERVYATKIIRDKAK